MARLRTLTAFPLCLLTLNLLPGISCFAPIAIFPLSSSHRYNTNNIHHLSHTNLNAINGDDKTPSPTIEEKFIFAISDSTGVTARSTIKKCLAQFNSCDESFVASDDSNNHDVKNQSAMCNLFPVQTRTFTFIRSESAISSLVQKARDKKAFIMFTIADPILRASALRMCELSNIPALDLLGPSLEGLTDFLGREAFGTPNPKSRSRGNVRLSDVYYRRIEAMEFTLKADDGQAPWLLSEADVILVGVSRTGKTPLSVVLSQTMGLKVANIPLVLEVNAPVELFGDDVDPKRIFCLTIAPSELKKIRTTRLERKNVYQVEEKYGFENRASYGADSNSATSGMNTSKYNDRAYVMNDLKNARNLSIKHNWTQVDVTGRAVEETASLISQLMNERFEDDELTKWKESVKIS